RTCICAVVRLAATAVDVAASVASPSSPTHHALPHRVMTNLCFCEGAKWNEVNIVAARILDRLSHQAFTNPAAAQRSWHIRAARFFWSSVFTLALTMIRSLGGMTFSFAPE